MRNICYRCYLTFSTKNNIFDWYCVTCIFSSCTQAPPHLLLVLKPPSVIEKNSFRRLSHFFHVTPESLFDDEREPLFCKRGKSDIFFAKKFVMSLFRAIFAFGNGREVATLGLVFLVMPSSCLRRAFVVPSLPEAEKGRREVWSKS